jgi:hypothetical protein
MQGPPGEVGGKTKSWNGTTKGDQVKGNTQLTTRGLTLK